MKLLSHPASPFGRKCLVSAYELGLRNRIELLPSSAHPINRDAALVARNPLGKLPVLIADDDAVLYDSVVICEYLNSFGNGRLVPPKGPARWTVLVEQALADGLMDAAVLIRYESAERPERFRWNDWIVGQMEKVISSLAEIERRAVSLGTRVDAGTIAVGCALGYLDFRFESLGWRDNHPKTGAWFERFSRRVSMVATAPPPA